MANNPMMIAVRIDKKEVLVRAGSTVASALLNSGCGRFRDSLSGRGRSALCGMGICFECRVTIDGVSGLRSCMIRVNEGMSVETGG